MKRRTLEGRTWPAKGCPALGRDGICQVHRGLGQDVVKAIESRGAALGLLWCSSGVAADLAPAAGRRRVGNEKSVKGGGIMERQFHPSHDRTTLRRTLACFSGALISLGVAALSEPWAASWTAVSGL